MRYCITFTLHGKVKIWKTIAVSQQVAIQKFWIAYPMANEHIQCQKIGEAA